MRVFVTVMDRDGRLVTNLAQDDFEVRDDGKAQPITAFDNTPLPIRLIVMLDVSGSMVGNLPLLHAASDQLFARLRPDDAARVGTFGHQVEISPAFTKNARRLSESLPSAIAPDAPTPLWRALDEALMRSRVRTTPERRDRRRRRRPDGRPTAETRATAGGPDAPARSSSGAWPSGVATAAAPMPRPMTGKEATPTATAGVPRTEGVRTSPTRPRTPTSAT